MTEKIECEAALYAALKRTAYFRENVAKRFPNDPRNLKAAQILRDMAKGLLLSDDQWIRLKPHYDRESDRWSDALTESGRRVGITPRVNDLPSFVSTLTDLLQVAQ